MKWFSWYDLGIALASLLLGFCIKGSIREETSDKEN